jgi:hypothetical protein
LPLQQNARATHCQICKGVGVLRLRRAIRFALGLALLRMTCD